MTDTGSLLALNVADVFPDIDLSGDFSYLQPQILE